MIEYSTKLNEIRDKIYNEIEDAAIVNKRDMVWLRVCFFIQ